MLRSLLDGLYRFAGYLAGVFLIVIFFLMMTLSVDVLSMPVLLPHDPFRMRRELDWL